MKFISSSENIFPRSVWEQFNEIWKSCLKTAGFKNWRDWKLKDGMMALLQTTIISAAFLAAR